MLYCAAFVRYLFRAQQSGCDRINGAAALQVDVVVWPSPDPAPASRTSGGVRAPHATAALGRTLILVQAAPGAVLFRPRDGVVQAFKPHRASSADSLGLALPDLPLGLTLTVRTEEEQQVLATARGSILPTPVRAGKHSRLPTYLRHGSNHLNQDASNSALQWNVGALSTRPALSGTSVARYNASLGRGVPVRRRVDRASKRLL